MLFTCRTVDRDWLKKPSSPSSSLPPAGPCQLPLHTRIHPCCYMRCIALNSYATSALHFQRSTFNIHPSGTPSFRPHILLSSVVRLAELKIDDWTQHGYAYCRHEWDGAGAAENIDRIDDSVVSEVSSIPAELLCNSQPDRRSITARVYRRDRDPSKRGRENPQAMQSQCILYQ